MSPPGKRKKESPVSPVAGERTWTIYECPDHGLAHGADPTVMPLNNYCAHCAESNEDGSYYLAAPVEVVELSRLRAAEEERDKIKARAEKWIRDLAREALASLEQKEE